MLAYLKLKTNDEELYETNYLEELKQKQTKFSKFQYTVCKYYYNFIAKLKYHMNIITVKQIYDAYLFILPFSDLSKIVLSFCMLAGRLEIYPMLILFSPSLWKKKY